MVDERFLCVCVCVKKAIKYMILVSNVGSYKIEYKFMTAEKICVIRIARLVFQVLCESKLYSGNKSRPFELDDIQRKTRARR